ncbi:MAG: hypothetical protein J7L15_04020 [Clostridiales bacterium]|nr:hypothetical protein [Clostridiales bacterium]
MAQISKELYADYAYQFHLSQEAMDGADIYLANALNEVVNLTSSVDGAVEIELALLQPTQTAYASLQNSIASISSTLDAVRALNNYVINNYVGSEVTATAKLTEFVDVIVWTDDVDETISGSKPSDDLVPCFWKNLCDSAGYDPELWAKIDPSC